MTTARPVRAGSFEPRLVPKGTGRADDLDDLIVSLNAGGMTVRDNASSSKPGESG